MPLFLRRIKCLFQNIYRTVRWYIDSWFERRKLTHINCKIEESYDNYFILMPHADDEWIGCSTFICDKKKNVTIIDTDMSGDDTPEIHKLRKNEVAKLALLYERDILYLKEDKSLELYSILLQHENSAVLVPFFQDWHEEHIQVMRILEKTLLMIKESSNNLPTIISYQVSLPIGDKHVNILHPMNKEQWKNKWSIFQRIYVSQQHISPIRFALNERINGALSDSFATEVFVLYEPEDWLYKINRMLLSETMREELKSTLHSISSVRFLMREI